MRMRQRQQQPKPTMTTMLANITTAIAMAFLVALTTIPTTTVEGFYLPGIKPHSFKEDDTVPLKVNAMTSVHTQMPKDYYSLPFCKPDSGPTMASENLGEFLTGNKIQTSPYAITMMRDSFCRVLCQTEPLTKTEARRLQVHVKFAYHNNWIVDNLPSAVIVNGATTMNTEKKQRHYAGGFPIGYILPKAGLDSTKAKKDHPQHDAHGEDKRKYTVTKQFWNTEDAYIYNHVNLHLDYHKPDPDGDGYRVVGFAVEPMSVKHSFVGGYDWDGKDTKGYNTPLSTCHTGNIHLHRSDISEPQIVKAGSKILFTYDVTWNPSDIRWASRWDVYLSEDHMVPAQVHWYSINNSLLVVVSLTILLASVLVRNLRRDIAGYNAVSTSSDEERDEELEEKGWKLIHADVFRPPTVKPMFFCVCVGTGVQLLACSFVSIVLSMIGFLNPARRGSLMISVLIFYMLCGTISGYVSAYLYKTFRGRQWQTCTMWTAIFFPGVTFTCFLFFNIMLHFFHSVGSVPFFDVFILVLLWCLVSIPLVFVGAYFGYKLEPLTFPTVTSNIARVVPESPSIWMNPLVSMTLAGLMPFSAAFVELFFIMTSLWMDQFYYVFGFTFVVFLIILITCSEVTILLCYYQLCAENHRWWWFSFVTAGSAGFYLFFYSFFWFSQLEASRMAITYMLYFGYMFVISLGMFLATGSIGFVSCLWFTRKIFASIKVD